MSPRPNSLATASLNRLSHIRKDDAWIAERWASNESRVHVVWRGQVAVVGSESAAVAPSVLRSVMADGHVPTLLGTLGTIENTAHFTVDLSHLEKSALENALHEDAMLSGLREVAAVLNADDANMLATASAMATWHAKHKFCGSCGAPTVVRSAGHERHCDGCGTDHFPRTDSAVIMLVTDGERAVLGRQKIWPQGMYSTLAGFLEPGESLEDTVRREVFEEVGLVVDDVKYSSSQPWPFPSSLMLGFHAHTSAPELNVDTNELETADWFTREQLLESRELGRKGFPMLPPPLAIARRLIDEWLLAD
jgi:NAD+ diphosphatase